MPNLVSDTSVTLLSFMFFFSGFSVIILFHFTSLILYIGFLFYLWHRVNQNYYYSIEKLRFIKLAGVISSILGIIGGINVRIILFHFYIYWKLHWVIFLFTFMLVNFHQLEFIFISLYSERTLNLSSFLLDDDIKYYLSLAIAFGEFIFQSYVFPNLKLVLIEQLFFIGFLIAACGEIFRKLAIAHAGSSFSHNIEEIHDPNAHKLVTSGIYYYCRHPSYLGWSMFVIGTQLMLGNLFSFCLFCLIIYNFFKNRIEYEESLLYIQFGDEYLEYAKNTPFGFPYIKSELTKHKDDSISHKVRKPRNYSKYKLPHKDKKKN